LLAGLFPHSCFRGHIVGKLDAERNDIAWRWTFLQLQTARVEEELSKCDASLRLMAAASQKRESVSPLQEPVSSSSSSRVTTDISKETPVASPAPDPRLAEKPVVASRPLTPELRSSLLREAERHPLFGIEGTSWFFLLARGSFLAHRPVCRASEGQLELAK
jgi:hypothetical protein